MVIVVSALIYSEIKSDSIESDADASADEFPISTPEEQLLDPVKLDSLFQAIALDEEYPDIHSLLIIRNDCLVLEEYFAGYDADTRHMIQSVSKSFTSTKKMILMK